MNPIVYLVGEPIACITKEVKLDYGWLGRLQTSAIGSSHRCAKTTFAQRPLLITLLTANVKSQTNKIGGDHGWRRRLQQELPEPIYHSSFRKSIALTVLRYSTSIQTIQAPLG